jgi:hypothetical protein
MIATHYSEHEDSYWHELPAYVRIQSNELWGSDPGERMTCIKQLSLPVFGPSAQYAALKFSSGETWDTVSGWRIAKRDERG